jgi:hypothetical protein
LFYIAPTAGFGHLHIASVLARCCVQQCADAQTALVCNSLLCHRVEQDFENIFCGSCQYIKTGFWAFGWRRQDIIDSLSFIRAFKPNIIVFDLAMMPYVVREYPISYVLILRDYFRGYNLLFRNSYTQQMSLFIDAQVNNDMSKFPEWMRRKMISSAPILELPENIVVPDELVGNSPSCFIAVGGNDKSGYHDTAAFLDMLFTALQLLEFENIHFFIQVGDACDLDFTQFNNVEMQVKWLSHERFLQFLKHATFSITSAGLNIFNERMALRSCGIMWPVRTTMDRQERRVRKFVESGLGEGLYSRDVELLVAMIKRMSAVINSGFNSIPISGNFVVADALLSLCG